MLKIGFAAAALTMLAAQNAHADCRIENFRFFPGQETLATLHAPSGKSCAIRLSANARNKFEDVAVTTPPRNGTTVSRGGLGVTYRSRPGFKGADAFTVAIKMTLHDGGSGTATLRVTVNVI
jgi:hypothetical protein